MKKIISILVSGFLIINTVPLEVFAMSGANKTVGNPLSVQDSVTEPAPDQVVTDNNPGQTQSEGSEISKELLQEILVDIKKRIVINDTDAKFTYSVGMINGQNYYDLVWEKENQTQSVRYGADKNIYNYNMYGKEETFGTNTLKKLPQYSVRESESIAKDFIAKAFPKEYKNFELKPDHQASNEVYSFGFDYYKNQIPVSGLYTNVDINYITGRVSSFYTDYQGVVNYDSPQGVISVEQAKTAYEKEIGLKRIYTFQYNEKEKEIENIRMAYVPRYGSEFGINAKSGKREFQDLYLGVGIYDKGGADTVQEITPMEQAEIEKKAGLRTMEEAKAAALDMKLFDKKGFEMTRSKLYERNYLESRFVWELEFTKDAISYTVDLDAKTLELVGFYNYNEYGASQVVTDRILSDAKSAANSFISKYAKGYEEQVQVSNVELDSLIGTTNDVVRMNFVRVDENNYFLENGINIIYNMASKTIVSYNLIWSDVKLPKGTKYADENIVYKQIFDENKIKLGYRLVWDEKAQEYQGKLLYTVTETNQLPLKFAVTTGERVVQSQTPTKVETYKDLSSSKYQNEMIALQQIGIGFAGGLLKPDIPVTEREVLGLIASSFEYSYGPVDVQKPREGEEKDWKNLGLLLEGEKVTNNPATREQVVKYLVRGLGYQKLALKSEIFTSPLRDFGSVSPEYKGYVAIGEALRMLDTNQGQNFNPKEIATREAALKMIYNYLAFQ